MTPSQRRELIRVASDYRLGVLHHERQFIRTTRAIMDALAETMANYLEPSLRKDSKPISAATGDIPTDVDRVLRAVLPQIGPKVRAAHAKLTAGLTRNYDRTMGKQLPALPFDTLDAPVKMQAALARESSVALVENAAREYAAGVREVFGDPAATLGVPWKELSKKLQERADVSKSRAELIARDQTLKLNGAINQAKQTELGIDGYIWNTSNDEKVRKSHKALAGQEFSWSAPPDVGHPGQDIQCRCVAIPII